RWWALHRPDALWSGQQRSTYVRYHAAAVETGNHRAGSRLRRSEHGAHRRGAALGETEMRRPGLEPGTLCLKARLKRIRKTRTDEVFRAFQRTSIETRILSFSLRLGLFSSPTGTSTDTRFRRRCGPAGRFPCHGEMTLFARLGPAPFVSTLR